MRVVLTSEAKADLTAAIDWYGLQNPQAVRRFIDEYDNLLQRLAENPQIFSVIRGTLRRAGFRRFPYGLIFRIHPDFVEIIACFHGRRDPYQWQGRD